VLFSLVYFLVRRILGAGRRPDQGSEIELLVLRHQMRVLQWQVTRPRLHRLDRIRGELLKLSLKWLSARVGSVMERHLSRRNITR
jgi:hypothetical protein